MRLIAVILVGLMGAGPATQSAAPTKPIEIATVVGSTASERGKVSVRLKITLANGKTKTGFEIAEDGSISYETIGLDASNITAIAEAVQTCADQITSNREGQKIGEIEVRVDELSGKRCVSICERKPVGQSKIYIDAENASSLANFLKKALRVSAWFDQRIGAFTN